MRLDTLLTIFSLFFLFIVACTKIEPYMTTDSCILFKEKKNWYKSTKKSYDKWKVPISLQLAIIKQESSFKQFAKPKRKKILGIIPGKRISSAFGYAQVTNPTWDWYKSSTGNKNASRANFPDITDFIGWYVEQSNKMLDISKASFYRFIKESLDHGYMRKSSIKGGVSSYYINPIFALNGEGVSAELYLIFEGVESFESSLSKRDEEIIKNYLGVSNESRN